ncbi:hypothetical protein ACFXPX_06675 [Kitasatospora sp. NPDC059146]|uniref:hypothetical protein n=1 Tax=Kitasatospora sp. NPDC059146 TaxID=3346741 RepID=UPI0036A2F804
MTGSVEKQPPEDLMVSAGLEIAARWGEAVGPEKLELALQALEPQLKREHEARMKRMDDIRAREERRAAAEDAEAKRSAALEKTKAELALRDSDRRRAHIYRMSGMISGVVISLSLLGAAVVVAPAQPWLASALSGPSLIALAKIFVLRRSEPVDIQEAGRTARKSASSSNQPPPSI